MGFVANFMCFPAVQKIESRLRFDKVTDSYRQFKGGNFFLRHSVHVLLRSCAVSVHTVGQ